MSSEEPRLEDSDRHGLGPASAAEVGASLKLCPAHDYTVMLQEARN